MMGISWIFVVINVFLACDGFLLDDRTSPATTSGPLLSDQHYNFLINLITNERQTRAKLEQHVVRLEQELLATQQGVTDIYHTSSINNVTLEQQTKNWNALYAKYMNLENENSLMKSNLNALRTDHTNLENYTKMLEREVTSLRHLKGVTDLQTVLDVRNETNILRKELKITNDSLNSVRNEAEARKQDFVALLNKAESTEHKLNMEIHNMSNRAAFTVCATENTYSDESIIMFPTVQTRNEVRNLTLTDMANSGKFRCEKAGLYVISGFFMTDSKVYARLDLYKNDESIAKTYLSVTAGYSFQTSTILILQYLNINDTIYVKSGRTMKVYGDTYSCISFLQLTN
ncbi:uncharacterized protein [Mytilus edulis]|uniref:uncharacterized protein n=1 Tax=Mytilus edulis TaxID=6550 RepID=UPI0039EE7BB1